jgi:hypothetical protein
MNPSCTDLVATDSKWKETNIFQKCAEVLKEYQTGRSNRVRESTKGKLVRVEVSQVKEQHFPT